MSVFSLPFHVQKTALNSLKSELKPTSRLYKRRPYEMMILVFHVQLIEEIDLDYIEIYS